MNSPMPDRPNLIVIVSDTLRPDHLGVNGHPRAKTPELDAWTARCVTFDNARVSSFPTIPMRTDWFTGRFGFLRHGWRDLDPQAVTLPKLLSQHGYTTQLIADTTHLLRANFWRPFDHFHFLRGHEGDEPLARLNAPRERVVHELAKTRVSSPKADDPTLADKHGHTNWRRHYEDESQIAELSAVACRWLEDNYRGGPFLLWLDCFDVHEPWFPPEYLWRMYQPEYEGDPMVHPNYNRADIYSAAELANLNARYLAMGTLLSSHLGRVIRRIEDTGLLENSIVVFMSDHGMYLGERGVTGKTHIEPGINDTWPFHVEVSRICWSMHFPPGLGVDNVRRLPQFIQAPDLLPTLLEAVGVELPEGVEGVSLMPLLRGETETGPREVTITCSTTGVRPPGEQLFARHPTVTDGTWTLVLSEPPHPAPPKLYYLPDDPTEQHDVFDQHPIDARRLHSAMLAWLKQHGLPREALERLSAANCGVG